MAQGHGAAGVGVHHDHVQEEHVAGLHLQGVVGVEHRRVDPERVVDRAHAVAAGVHAVLAKARGVQDPRMGGEDISHRPTRTNRLRAGLERVDAGGVHRHVLGMGVPCEQGAHHRGVVAPVRTRELQGELVLRVQVPAPAEVPAQQSARTRSDDELVAGVVAAAAEHRALHGGEDVALEGARGGRAAPLRPRRRRRAPAARRGRTRSPVDSSPSGGPSIRVEASVRVQRPASSASSRRQWCAFSP